MAQNQRLNLKPTKAILAVLEFGTIKGYSWKEVPPSTQRPTAIKRIFNRRTIRNMERAGLIKYRPASFYVTGKGRKFFRDHKESTHE